MIEIHYRRIKRLGIVVEFVVGFSWYFHLLSLGRESTEGEANLNYAMLC